MVQQVLPDSADDPGTEQGMAKELEVIGGAEARISIQEVAVVYAPPQG